MLAILAHLVLGTQKWQMTQCQGENDLGSSVERSFNLNHMVGWAVVEHAFGRPRGKLEFLPYVQKTSLDIGTHSIMVATSLHILFDSQNDGF